MSKRFETNTRYFFFYWLIIIMIASCAKPVAPTGGPKDETPPKVLRSLPLNGSTNFTGNEIVITFDEFVNLKDINQQLIISPPVKETPEFKLRGKSLLVQFKEPLREETTYNVFFGDAIQDITENNSIPGFKFTFSTGNVLDSMMIEGKVLSAFSLTPVKAAYVMLYDTIYDSVPYKQIPYYIARTNEKGEFQLTNLRNLSYKIFGLSDINSNYLFDLPNEEISFVDTIISPWTTEKKLPVTVALSGINGQDTTIVSDSVEVTIFKNDSIAITDTIQPAPMQDSTAMRTDSTLVVELEKQYIQMFHFREVDSVQVLLKASLLRENVLNINYRFPVKSPGINFLSEGYTATPVIGRNRISDTLTVWLPEYTADSIKFEMTDFGKVLDTIEMSVKPREKPGKKNEIDKAPSLKITNNLASGKIKPGSPLRLSFPDPLFRSTFESIILMEDSLTVTNARIDFGDSVKTKVTVRYPWKEGVNYTLILPDSIFTSVFGHSNDSTGIKFSGLKEEETSIVSLSLDIPEDTPYIIQLLDTKEKVIEQYHISTDLVINFKYLIPGKYKLKAIDDRNGNGYWDTGKYIAHRYPERVLYFNKELELRANWALEEQWTIPEPGK